MRGIACLPVRQASPDIKNVGIAMTSGWLEKSLDDAHKISGHKGSAADESAIHILL